MLLLCLQMVIYCHYNIYLPKVQLKTVPDNQLRPDLAVKVTQHRISKEDISVGDQCLGKGYFGIVYKGQLKTQNGSLKTVAIKGFKGKSYKSPERRIIFMFFLILMKILKRI